MLFDEIQWYHPPGSRLEVQEEVGKVVFVPGSDGVVLDDEMAQVWQAAQGQTAVHLQQMGYSSLLAAQLRTLQVAGLLLPPPKKVVVPLPKLPDVVPLVSVIIVSRNGQGHLAECLPSLVRQSYPHLEIIIVDDHSTDGTADWLREQFPQVRLVAQSNGPNFAAGNNVGVAAAQGELFFLLNNDTVVEPDCVAQLVATWLEQPNVGGVAAMLRFYRNRPFVNGLGTQLRRFGFGHDGAIGALDVGQFQAITAVPLLCFGAVLIPRTAWEKVGPLDEAYQFYYEDTDWSYRARLCGLNLVAAPRARVYHKFSASTGALPSTFKMGLVTRNRLWFVLKNFPFPLVLLQVIFFLANDVMRMGHDWWQGKRPLAYATLHAWGQATRQFPRVWRQRRQMRLTWEPLLPANPLLAPQMTGSYPQLTSEIVMLQHQHFLSPQSPNKYQLLIISPDSIDANMGGVGIRYWELGHQLADVAIVTLAIPQPTTLQSDTVHLVTYEEGDATSLEQLARAADIILFSGFTIYHHPFLQTAPQYLIVDLYDPMILENLERFANKPLAERNGLHQVGVSTFNKLFAAGDFFVCASEKQRDYWLGALSVANRVNPTSYTADPTLRQLLDLVPFGVPAAPPKQTRLVLKGVRSGIAATDKVIVWGGGLWDWLDPLTVIEVMPSVLAVVPEARLFFLGIKHPNPAVPPSRMAERALARAEALGLLETAVFYNQWTPYAERVDYLLEADVAISLHGDHIETRFAVRTRLMDYLWARLPMVVTGGDVLGELVQTHGLGITVNAGDKAAVAQALITLLQHPVPAERFQPIIAQFTWGKVAEPLRAYVAAPWRNREQGQKTAVVSITPWRQLPIKAIHALRERGLTGLLKEIRAYLTWITQD